MKRILAIILTTLMLFSSVAFAQTNLVTTTTQSTQTVTPVTTTDPLVGLINRETNPVIKEKLQAIAANRETIKGLRATSTLKIITLKQLIAAMPEDEDDDNEALDEARDMVESFKDKIESGIAHDAKIARDIERILSFRQTRQNMAITTENNANGEKRRMRTRGGRQDDDDERKNGRGRQNVMQNRRSERNENAILKRIDNILRFQQRIIERLQRRITRIDKLIDILN